MGLAQMEFNKRCHEVFVSREGDKYFYMDETENGISITMEEIDERGEAIIFEYRPDMTERPEALAYLFGTRADFND